MNTKRLWAAVLILAVATTLKAERIASIVVDSGFTRALLNAQVVVLAEKTAASMPADSVLKLPDSAFIPLTSKSFLFGLAETSRWIRFSLVNDSPTPRHLFLEIANPNLRRIKVYQYWGDLLLQSDSAGIDFPYNQRHIAAQNFLMPVHLRPSDTIVCLIYIAPSYQPANFDLYLWQRNYRMTAQATRESLALGGFFLVHFIFLMLLVAVSLSFRIRELWYYTIYVLLGALFVFSDIGLGYRFVWSNVPYLQKIMTFLIVNLYTIFGTQFIRVYFQTRKRYPLFDQIFFVAIGISSAFVLFVLFLPLLPLKFVYLLNVLQYALFLVCSALFVALFLRTMNRKNRYWSAWFLLGFSLHGAGIVLTILQYMRLLPHYSLPSWLFEIGVPLSFYTQTLMMAGMILEIPIVLFIAFARFKYILKQNEKQAGKLAELRANSMNELILGVESERRRLSQDLHDGLSVNLAAMKMKANLMEMQSEGKARDAWREMMTDLENAYDELRRISHNLPPKSLFRAGLHGALEEIIQRARMLRPEMNIMYHNNLPLLRLSKHAEVNLYRITLELLNNALKHSEATQLSVQWLLHEGEAVLTVEDNGKGFTPGKTAAGEGIGLSNVYSRVAVLGGTLSIDSRPGHGAIFVARLPEGSILAKEEEPVEKKRSFF